MTTGTKLFKAEIVEDSYDVSSGEALRSWQVPSDQLWYADVGDAKKVANEDSSYGWDAHIRHLNSSGFKRNKESISHHSRSVGNIDHAQLGWYLYPGHSIQYVPQVKDNGFNEKDGYKLETSLRRIL